MRPRALSPGPTRHGSALALLLVGLLAVGAPVMADDEPTDGSRIVSNAEFRWGMSNEANNRAHAPGTWNFFSAGKIPDPGRGNTKLQEEDWEQSAGNVEIEKWNGTAYTDATWSGLSTDSDGNTIPSASSGRYSNHQFVFGKGTGTAAADGSAAHIEWDGDVSVISYSGYTFFYLSDPVLDVADGKGTVTATLSGFGSSQADPTVWEPIEPRTVTIADLPSVSLASVNGFTAVPAFDDVKVDTASCPNSGSFPKTFIGFQEDLGTAAFWCRTGSGTDAAKKALPLTVSFDASAPVVQPTPTPTPTPTPAPTESPSPSPTTAPNTKGGTTRLTGAELRWGMTNEANNKAHAPNTWNFFSAGKIPNTKGEELAADRWKQSAGNVAIEKWDGRRYGKATWSGLRTDSSGDPIASATSGRYSNHQFVFGNGTGRADTAKGTVHVEWSGDVSIVFYSGYTFFYLSDPVLDVADGKGTLTATLSGYGGSRDDPSDTTRLDPRVVTVAELPRVSLADNGFEATPAFGKVKTNTASCKNSGSFPRTFVQAQEKLGTAGFWCRTGASTDDAKAPLPLTVSFDATDPIESAEPDDDDSDSADDVSNSALTAPLSAAMAAVAPPLAAAARAVADAVSFPVRLVAATATESRSALWVVGTFLWVQAAITVAVALRFPTPEASGRSPEA